MLIIELTYKKSLDEVERYFQEHRDFLSKYYDRGVFMASGPKEPRDGGVILAKAKKADVEKIIREDPLHKNEIADYKVIQFNPNRASDECFVLINDR